MEKRIILISKEKSFMVSAMVKNLSGEDFDVILCSPEIGSYVKIDNRPSVVLAYLDGDVGPMQEFLAELRSVTRGQREEISLFLIGSPEDAGRVEAYLASHGCNGFVQGVFERPLNVKSLAESLGREEEEERAPSGKRHILVVDDDATMLRTLKLWLSDKYFVYMANSGMNAISVLKSNHVDLVLLDYEMPEISGPEVLKLIKDDPDIADIPVMILTAKNDQASIDAVMELHPAKYLLKTMAPDELMSNIEEYFVTV